MQTNITSNYSVDKIISLFNLNDYPIVKSELLSYIDNSSYNTLEEKIYSFYYAKFPKSLSYIEFFEDIIHLHLTYLKLGFDFDYIKVFFIWNEYSDSFNSSWVDGADKVSIADSDFLHAII